VGDYSFKKHSPTPSSFTSVRHKSFFLNQFNKEDQMNTFLQFVVYFVALVSMDRLYEVLPEGIKKNAYLRLLVELSIIGLFIATYLPATSAFFNMEIGYWNVLVTFVTVFIVFFMMRGNSRYKENPIQGPLTFGQWAIFIWIGWVILKAVAEKLS